MIKKLLGLFLLVVLCSIPARAQVGNTTTIRFAGAPTGTCAPLNFGINSATGALYDCVGGTWTLVGSGGAATCPGGSNTQVLYNNAGACGGIAGSVWSGTTLAFSHTATATGNGFIQILGDGLGSNLTLLDVVADDFNSYAQCWGNAQAVQRWCAYVNDATMGAEDGWMLWAPVNYGAGISITGSLEVAGGGTAFSSTFSTRAADPADAGLIRMANAESICSEANPTGTDQCITLNTSNVWTLGSLAASANLSAATYSTATNCSDSAGAAACGAAPAGLVVIDAGATSVVISTTAVTANSDVFFQATTSAQAATRLGIGGCNATVAIPTESARTAATSVTATIPVAPVTTPLCLYYWFAN